MEKKISIIIPIYNSEPFLGYCIESICRQTIEKDLIEIILVNDASTDGSSEICLDYAARYEYIKVISLPENVGTSAARNRGVRLAKGEYLFFADSDDWLGPECLQRLLSYAEETDSDFVIGRVIAVDRGEKAGRVAWCRVKIIKIDEDLENNFHFYATMGPWGRLIRRDIIMENNIEFPEDMYMFEDIYWNVEVMHYASKAVLLNDYDYYFLRRDRGVNTMTSNKEELTKSIIPEQIFHSIDKLTSLAEEYGYEEDHPFYKRIFRVCVRDGFSFISTAGSLAPERYPERGRMFKEMIWKRVNQHYTAGVRNNLSLEQLCHLDAFAAGLDYDKEDSIFYYANAKYNKTKASQRLKSAPAKGTYLPAYLSEEAVLRLTGGQAESYSFSSTFEVENGMVHGQYLIALKVTDDFAVEMEVHYGEKSFRSTVAMDPDVWGEEYQECGHWHIQIDPECSDVEWMSYHIMAGTVEIATGRVNKWDKKLGRPAE